MNRLKYLVFNKLTHEEMNSCISTVTRDNFAGLFMKDLQQKMSKKLWNFTMMSAPAILSSPLKKHFTCQQELNDKLYRHQ
jgi:hypothetical protein